MSVGGIDHEHVDVGSDEPLGTFKVVYADRRADAQPAAGVFAAHAGNSRERSMSRMVISPASLFGLVD